MISFVLTFVACLGVGGAERCQHVKIPFDGSLMQCMLLGRHQAAAWTNDHPGWSVTRGWKCEAGRAI